MAPVLSIYNIMKNDDGFHFESLDMMMPAP
jgi:hypothetical protein